MYYTSLDLYWSTSLHLASIILTRMSSGKSHSRTILSTCADSTKTPLMYILNTIQIHLLQCSSYVSFVSITISLILSVYLSFLLQITLHSPYIFSFLAYCRWLTSSAAEKKQIFYLSLSICIQSFLMEIYAHLPQKWRHICIHTIHTC